MKSYTFHVSLPGMGRVWRKVELCEDQTLEDLHFAIQDAYDFDCDHLYSFFMSGKAWDPSTEYRLPDSFTPFGELIEYDEEVEDEEPVAAGEEEPLVDEALVENLRVAFGDVPPLQSIEEMVTLIETNRELRGQLKQMISDQLSIPAFMADLLLSNIRSLLESSSLFGVALDDEVEDADFRDVRDAVIGSLNLPVGKTFMYLFDYGDEWRFKVRVHAINDHADPNAEYPRIVESVGQAPPQYPTWDNEDDEDEAEEDE